jgi:hypothetical protein
VPGGRGETDSTWRLPQPGSTHQPRSSSGRRSSSGKAQQQSANRRRGSHGRYMCRRLTSRVFRWWVGVLPQRQAGGHWLCMWGAWHQLHGQAAGSQQWPGST